MLDFLPNPYYTCTRIKSLYSGNNERPVRDYVLNKTRKQKKFIEKLIDMLEFYYPTIKRREKDSLLFLLAALVEDIDLLP